MTLFILTETSAGYALLKAKDKKLLKRDDLAAETETAEGVCNLLVIYHARKYFLQLDCTNAKGTVSSLSNSRSSRAPPLL